MGPVSKSSNVVLISTQHFCAAKFLFYLETHPPSRIINIIVKWRIFTPPKAKGGVVPFRQNAKKKNESLWNAHFVVNAWGKNEGVGSWWYGGT